MKQFFKKPYLLFFSILLFFTPLILVTNTNELFEFPKMFFIYIFGLFIIFFFISDLIINKPKIVKPSVPILLFLLSTFLSTIFSSHFYTSFFGYYSRFNDGFLSYLIFFGLYFVAINKLNREDLFKLLEVSLLPIVPISIYGLIQHFGGPSIFWNLPAVERAYSTIGQPNWLAQYLSMLLPVCLFFAITDSFNKFKYWFFLYSIGFFCLWVTYSMSGLVGFISGVVVLSLVITHKKKDVSNYSSEMASNNVLTRVAFLVLISLSISITNMGIFKGKVNDAITDIKRTVSVVKKVYALDNSYEISDPGFIRIELWKSTFKLIKSSPKVFLIGTGPETFPYHFQPFRNTKLNYSSEWDYVFNKPHNYYLELWCESGVLTLLAYMLLLYILSRKLPWFLIPSLIVFMVTNIFGWPTVSTTLIFWFFLSWSDIWRKE
ncbi:MAG: O-antigen ligase family protein [Patescibacteria group bacterium]